MPEDPYQDAYADENYTNITPAIKAITIDPYSDEYTHAPDDDDVTYYSTPASKAPTTLNSPSENYLNTSQLPSTHLEDPTTVKKLLVLDLNGTLVYREKHRLPRDDHQRDNGPQNDSTSDDVYARLPPGPHPLRIVNPRPYIASFREYLFHPSTRRWLDTMVWSSAQPHSVKDMVEKCFGEDAVEEEEHGHGRRGRGRGRNNRGQGVEVDEFGREKRGKLVASWARDTLGLDSNAYHKKTQTTKDLTKPWKWSRIHSAETTVLLDDSPLKAKLQPHNHLCVPEYTRAMREWDVGVVEQARLARQNQGKPETSGGPDDSTNAPTNDPVQPDATDEDKKEQPPLNPSLKRKRSSSSTFDHTLLAVIGILDAVKYQSNVASWIREEGVWADDAHSDEEEEEEEDGEDGLHSLYLANSPDFGEAGEAAVDPNMRKRVGPKARWRTNKNTKRKRRKIDQSVGETEKQEPEVDEETEVEAEREGEAPETGKGEADGDVSDASQSTSKDEEPATKTSTSHSAATLTDSGTDESQDTSAFASANSLKKPSTLTYTESIGTFEPIAFLDTRKSGSPFLNNSTDAEDDITIPGLSLPFGRSPTDILGLDDSRLPSLEPTPSPKPMMWYQDKQTRMYWVNRGRKALEELGIECIPGVVPR
ncbi:hypothetical protein V5O48_001528 [Marasmius crinis-equi]|uniref:FCP1 homology domain-containing protein n=1 Tax=Marasmius crinis-equi TaxID=585013 RepID=A0ABR3FY33_9AGAR